MNTYVSMVEGRGTSPGVGEREPERAPRIPAPGEHHDPARTVHPGEFTEELLITERALRRVREALEAGTFDDPAQMNALSRQLIYVGRMVSVYPVNAR